MNTHKTHELKVSFSPNREGAANKEAIISWLKARGIDSFVEGVIDNLDIDHEFGMPDQDFYDDNGGDFSPIILCSFDEDYISNLHQSLDSEFGSRVHITQVEMDTESWQNGWKDSFQPILTDLFRIDPPWESAPEKDTRIRVEIEPGMAFGTGQHASTQVCLRVLESLVKQTYDFSKSNVLDLGTGSGILAIALAQLGTKNLWATDIDKDAIIAAKLNSQNNGVDFKILEASLPTVDFKFDLILANILYTVLAPMTEKLSSALAPQGKMIFSGLIEEQVEDMLGIAKEHGLRCLHSESVEGWVALLFEKI